MELRKEAQAHGAEEAVIVNDRGEPIEAAACSVVWWKDGALWRVAASEPILNGVTKRLLGELAEQFRVQFEESSISIAEIGDHEAWLVNALIGIVPVTRWLGYGERAPVDLDRLAAWRSGLAALAVPVG
jgi:branched-subunit amino acid aminotransferase/4-amino-4-deoxychorismate lyase